MSLPPLNALWVEGRLSWLERACLKSAVSVGHEVTLWTYFGVEGAPEGVAVRDGREVMPESGLLKHKKRNSWSLGSNIFRYRLMEQRCGAWMDADVYFLKPMPWLRDDVIYGWQKPGLLNGAILYIADDSPLLPALFSWLGQRHIVPPWLRLKKRWRYELTKRLNLTPIPLEEHHWGVAGPRAITHCAGPLGLLEHAQPVDVFYPLPPKRAKDAFNPSVDVLAETTDRTITVHLWNEEVKALKKAPPPAGSFAAHICAEQGIDPTDG